MCPKKKMNSFAPRFDCKLNITNVLLTKTIVQQTVAAVVGKKKKLILSTS